MGSTFAMPFTAETANRVVESLFADESRILLRTCFMFPAPDMFLPVPVQRLIELKRWNGRTQATQVYHMGCYAALPALRIAAGLLSHRRRSRARAEIVHTELCTLHFNPADHSPEQLIIQTLFADGHIRYSVVPGARGGSPGLTEAHLKCWQCVKRSCRILSTT